MTTRAVSFDLLGSDGSTQAGEITFVQNVPELVDLADNAVYVANVLTYSLAVGESEPLITTDNAGTSPAAGSWGYTVVCKLPPGIPDITVSNGLLPSGSGAYSLAAMIATAQAVD